MINVLIIVQGVLYKVSQSLDSDLKCLYLDDYFYKKASLFQMASIKRQNAQKQSLNKCIIKQGRTTQM